MQLTDVATQKYDIGRSAIFRAPVFDGTFNLFDMFEHIGNTEGQVDLAMNPEYSELTLPETSGPAALKRYLTGEKPTFELGVFPNPDNIKIFSPTGRGSAGQKRRRAVVEHCLWIVPEQLFLKPDENGNEQEVEVTHTFAGGFLKDGVALTAEEQVLLDLSIILWRCDFGRATPLYKHEDGGKSLRSVPVSVQQDLTKPDGCQLMLVVGELADFDTLDLFPLES